jgi:hypothetical protein
MRRALLASLAVGCGSVHGIASDAAGEASSDTSIVDAPALDAPSDAAPDAMPDAMIDAGTGMVVVDVGSSGCPNSFKTSEVYAGSAMITNPLDLQFFHEIRAITGDVTMTLPDVALPNLSYVGGNLAGTAPSSFVAPKLCYVAGGASFYSNQLDVSGLRDVEPGLAFINDTWTSLTVPSLSHVSSLWLAGAQLANVSFPQLTAIDGKLTIGAPFVSVGIRIANFTGFSSVGNVGLFEIDNASELSDFTGLEHVHALPAVLFVQNAPKLVSLRGLGLGLTPGPIAGIFFDNTPALSDITVLAPVTSIGSWGIYIHQAFNLASIDALSSVQQLDGGIDLYANKRLDHIRFDSVTTMKQLKVDTNRSLTSISMASLARITADPMNNALALYINGNGALGSIALPALIEANGPSDITANPLLPTCQATRLAAQITVPPLYSFYIAGNGTGSCP